MQTVGSVPLRSLQPAPVELHERVTFIGNATILLRLAGRTILTDPNFVPAGENVPLGYGLSARRLLDPAVTFDGLPPVDLVLLSHLHGDHFDRIAEARLSRELPIVTTQQAADQLAELGFRGTIPLDTWESHQVDTSAGRLRITALPARHAPSLLSVALPHVMGSLLETWGPEDDPSLPARRRIYISGDTIVNDGLREIRWRHPDI
ncbi:MAG: MBL fold metallo-hydrolase, partial [Chloroflexota bacterium]